MIKKVFFICLLFIGTILAACSNNEFSASQPLSTDSKQNSTNDQIIKELLVKNLSYATSENINGYLSTISQKGKESTREAMLVFFEEYDVEHILLEFEIVEEESDKIVVKARQKSKGTSHLEDVEYKNHIAEVLHVFMKEQDNWIITESSITDITFIE